MRHPCKEAVDAAEYLKSKSMPDDLFAKLHHSSLKGGKETANATIRYFGATNLNLRTRNRDYVQRLRFVSESHQRTGVQFTSLVTQALEKWPLKDR